MNSVVDNQPPLLEEQKRENTPSVVPSSPPDIAIMTRASPHNNNKKKKKEVDKMNDKDDDNKSNRGISSSSSSASLPVSFTPHSSTKGVLEASSSCYPPVPRGGPHASQPSTPIHNTPSTGIGSSTSSRRVNLRDSVMYPSYKSRLAIFDDYEFFDKAGEGAFGKVLVVRHKTTKHVRACKAMGLHSPQQRDLIQTETDLLKSLDHPNILKLFETYVDGSNMYLIMELCEGGSLQNRIDYHYQRLHSPMTEGQVAMYMQQILSAIAYCHKQGILHRDLKPENILFVNRLVIL
ncbi:hypothetical protein FOZ61_002636 [Perkinsus olseni]|uniref:non-specific serine/threonine protein kinase n=1 Tax=Perkinsus olseni TaxID=32597 RepID=A0A7J6KN30_PEROL|nr:hypothetical protein FOZ61_002636 [Perkinsus olseni]